MQLLNRLILLLAVCALGLGAYVFSRWRVDDALNQQRLQVISNKYDVLESKYEDVVRKTAVTELLVENGQLSVVIRTVKGPLQQIATPFDPAQEIYVDYVVLNGRLWIRRIFDGKTPPEKAFVLDPELASIDWDNADVPYGKAVYRRLTEGRWVITVTGNGALGLAKVSDQIDPGLTHAPPVGPYETVLPPTN